MNGSERASHCWPFSQDAAQRDSAPPTVVNAPPTAPVTGDSGVVAPVDVTDEPTLVTSEPMGAVTPVVESSRPARRSRPRAGCCRPWHRPVHR